MLLRLRAGRVGYFVPNFQNSSSQRVNPPTFEQYIPFVFSWINEYKRLRELDRILAESQFLHHFRCILARQAVLPSGWKFAFHELHGLVFVAQASFELSILY